MEGKRVKRGGTTNQHEILYLICSQLFLIQSHRHHHQLIFDVYTVQGSDL